MSGLGEAITRALKAKQEGMTEKQKSDAAAAQREAAAKAQEKLGYGKSSPDGEKPVKVSGSY